MLCRSLHSSTAVNLMFIFRKSCGSCYSMSAPCLPTTTTACHWEEITSAGQTVQARSTSHASCLMSMALSWALLPQWSEKQTTGNTHSCSSCPAKSMQPLQAPSFQICWLILQQALKSAMEALKSSLSLSTALKM